MQKIFNSQSTNRPKDRVSVNRNEEKELLKLVLEHAQSMLKHYSIEDPTNRYIDLMLAPILIDEALEMLEDQSIGTRSLLIEYQVIEHKQKRLQKVVP